MSLPVFTSIHAQDHIIDDSKTPRFLYVLSAESGSLKEGKLTLKKIPAVIYFSDRPYRVAGQLSLNKFINGWSKGADSFETVPPNAVLSIYKEDTPINIVIELKDPVLKDGTLSFTTVRYDDQEVDSFNQVSLFVDPFPTSMNSFQ
jgi:hypothetical protein